MDNLELTELAKAIEEELGLNQCVHITGDLNNEFVKKIKYKNYIRKEGEK